MGIIADTMAEAVERSQTTMEGVVSHLRRADTVELVLSDPSIVQLNVDGIMLVRIDAVTSLITPDNKQVDDKTDQPAFLVDNRKAK